jgi:hypothetical protein
MSKRGTAILDGLVVEYNMDKETKDLIFGKLLLFYTKHEVFCTESLMQDDSAQLDAAEFLGELAEEAFKFDWSYDE